MAQQGSEAMLWFTGRWWWFPGAHIGTESQFEWRGDRLFLLKPDGSRGGQPCFMSSPLRWYAQ